MNKALAIARPDITFAAIKPPVGITLQLERPGMPGRMTARMLGYIENTSVIVSIPKMAGKPVNLEVGQQLQVKMITGLSLYGFKTTLISVVEQPEGYWHLTYPSVLKHKLLRQQTRVPVNLVVLADELVEGQLYGSWPKKLLCTDISLTGMNLLSKQPLGVAGDQLYITLRLKVAAEDHVVLVSVRICNQPVSTSSTGHRYGVEFLDLSEEARLVVAGFVYQQCLLETGYGDYLVEVSS